MTIEIVELVAQSAPTIAEISVDAHLTLVEVNQPSGPVLVELAVPGMMGPPGRDGVDGGAQNKEDIGLGEVDNTSDLDKPISTAVQAALDTKSPFDHSHAEATGLSGGFFSASDKTKLDGIAIGAQANTVTSVAEKTGDVVVTKSDVGLGNVDNTSDASKPISTATATALSGKSDTGHTHISATSSFAGFMSASDKVKLDSVTAGAEPNAVSSVAGRSGAVTLAKADVGLSNVDNTSDADKPISAAVTAALSGKSDNGHTHSSATTSVAGFLSATDKTKLDSVSTGAAVTSVAGRSGAVTLAKADVGLGNVDNTSDANKPVSTATATALSGKAATIHAHAVSDVTGLQASLDAKAPVATASAGAGQIATIGGTNSVALPAGGTWAYFYVGYNGTGNITTYGSGVGAGGATVASVASTFFGGFAWRQS